MNAISQPGLARVRALYASLVSDRAFLDGAPIGAPGLAIEAATLIHAEARLLDRRQFDAWVGLWEEDATFWVPLHGDFHPSADQSLLLDDYRRLRERVWRMYDTSAWALQPPPQVVRLVGSVEAWETGDDELLATSAIAFTHERLQQVLRLAGRQIHRLRRKPDGLHIVRKILLSPDITAGTPHLGWLL